MASDRQYQIVAVSFNPANVVTKTAAEQAITVTGAAVGDAVIVNKPSCTAGVGIVGARVTAANTVGVVFANATAGDLNPAAETYLFALMRP